MQIIFNSYEEMMDFMEKIQGRASAKEEKAVTTAEEMKQHSVSESCQSTPVSAPVQNVPSVSMQKKMHCILRTERRQKEFPQRCLTAN